MIVNHLINDIYKFINKKFSWEALFAWKEVNKFGLTYKKKKNIQYNEGLGKDGRKAFNTDDSLFKLHWSKVWRLNSWIEYNFNFCT